VERDVCWWGGMSFLPHVLRLLAKRHVHVQVTFGRAAPAGQDRKALAREMQRHIEALSQGRMPSRHRDGRPVFARKPPFPPLAAHKDHSPITSERGSAPRGYMTVEPPALRSGFLPLNL